MIKSAIVLLFVFISPCVLGAPNSNQVMEILKSGDKDMIQNIVKELSENSSSVDSFTLLMASLASIELKKYKDAAFFYYVAKVRYVDDRAHFPPVRKGGNDPGVFFSALASNLPIAFNVPLSENPEAMVKIANRIKTWQPKFTKSYLPGWEFREKSKDPGKQKDMTAAIVQYLAEVSKMLKSSEYQSLLEEFRNYSKLEDKQPDDVKHFMDLSDRGQNFEENWGTKFIFHQY